MSARPPRRSVATATRGAPRQPDDAPPPARAGVATLARWWLLPVGGAAVAVVACLIAAGSPGFPEDDAWIHQDFARTLALTGHLAFQPGGSGAGSTSPLWVLLLAPLHLVTRGHAPVWLVVGWAALLGGLALAGVGVLSGLATAELARRAGASAREARILAGLAGLCVVGEWQLVWAALSGMETDLFAFLTMLLIVAASRQVRPLWLGLVAGVSIWARPEGALAGVLVLGCAAWQALAPVLAPAVAEAPPGRRAQFAAALRALGPWCRRWALPFAAGTVICLVPYLLLNLAGSGHLLPSTVYAKFASVAGGGGMLAQLGDYILQMGVVLALVNPMLVLVAALLGAHWLARRIAARRTGAASTPAPASALAGQSPAFPLATLLWVWPLALAALYAVRLPGAWQYGRYLMPGLPPLMAVGCARLRFVLRPARRRVAQVAPVAGVLFVLAAVLSLGVARQLYTSNVQGINDYHVAVALWLRAHTPPGSIIATHDIGAIGYFSDRPVVDFAGLADPELIPLLGNQAALEAALKQRHVAYVAMRQDWFPPPNLLLHDLAGHEVYQACGLGFCFGVYQTGW